MRDVALVRRELLRAVVRARCAGRELLDAQTRVPRTAERLAQLQRVSAQPLGDRLRGRALAPRQRATELLLGDRDGMLGGETVDLQRHAVEEHALARGDEQAPLGRPEREALRAIGRQLDVLQRQQRAAILQVALDLQVAQRDARLEQRVEHGVQQILGVAGAAVEVDGAVAHLALAAVSASTSTWVLPMPAAP